MTKRVPIFPVFLGLIFVVFNAILVFVYLGAKEANPVILDQHGNPRHTYESR